MTHGRIPLKTFLPCTVTVAERQRLGCMQASKLPPAVDRAWEKIGGGPADLYFPEEFLGVWNVESTLTSIKLPLGPDFVPDPKVGSHPKRRRAYLEGSPRRLSCITPGKL